MRLWVLVDVGCIECGCENEDPVVGVYATLESAKVAFDKEAEKLDEWVAECKRRGYDHLNYHRDGYSKLDTSDGQVRLVEMELQLQP